MNILITGGTGFLGGEAIEYFSKHNMVYATYRNKKGRKIKNVKWIKLDLTNIKDFKEAEKKLKGISVIIHIGGATPNRAYKEGSFKATTEGTKNLLNLAKKAKVKKFIFISSISVKFPHNGPYKNSKLIAEKDVKNSKINYTIIQPGTIIGPNAKDFARLVNMISRNKFFPIIGKGNNKSQPISSGDLIKIIEECINNKETDNKTFIAVGKEAITTRQLVKKIAKIFNNKIILIPIPKTIALIFAAILNFLNPRIGMNRERIEILSYSREYDKKGMKLFKVKLKTVDQMLSFLKGNTKV